MKRVLDIGCGNGNLLNYIAKRNKRDLLFGIDIGKEIIDRANKNKFCNREKFILGDGKKLDFEDGFFDEVYCYEVLEHVENLDEVLSEIKRVLKKDGKLKITVPLEESEKILIKYNKNYPNQVGHRRFFSRKKIGMKTEIPFAPFLILGTLLTFLFNLDIVSLINLFHF